MSRMTTWRCGLADGGSGVGVVGAAGIFTAVAALAAATARNPAPPRRVGFVR